MDNQLSTEEIEFEELVLRESIVGATGLNERSIEIGIKGDPSLRETSLERKKYESPVDKVMSQLVVNIEDLLLNRSTYRVFIGFNSGEIRTHSIFDPLRQEIHAAEKLADQSYINRQFPLISYADKIQGMRDIYEGIQKSKMFESVPSYWKNIFIKRHKSWEPMLESEIKTIMQSMKVMRALPDFYLRNITICIVQDLVRMQFNCDGTQIISAENYQKFLEQNIPNPE
ncbi:MAG: hypothetical protein OEY87_08870 [Gammaproteobacteria bacterium]|nr:hypothetical protein [Gammaproteobacteria bacterium]MDH5736218.1 hypothetical protein [Gammaproteobacteria bacterium]